MQEIRSSNPPVVTGICDPNKSRARHRRSLKLSSKLKYLIKDKANFKVYDVTTLLTNNYNTHIAQYLMK